MPTISGTSDLTSYLQTFPQYQNSTYTARRQSAVYSLGFTSQIQILNAPFYLGIRDIGASIAATAPVYHGTANLDSYIRSTIQASQDLGAYSKVFFPATGDLPAYIGAHFPADLAAAVKVIRFGTKDLISYVIPELFKGTADLGGIIYKIFSKSYKNLGAYLRSNWSVMDLPVYLQVISVFNLPAAVRSVRQSVFNLNAILNVWPYKNLSGSLHGWDLVNLPASATGVYGPYDLQAYLRVHPYLNLTSTITGWYSSTINLSAILSGWQSLDLLATISPIASANLTAQITALGYAASLGASIIPKTIRIKRAVLVSLLEHKDLAGIINIGCFGTDSKNLPAYLTANYKLDLGATIWGARPLNFYKDLAACINSSNYTVENKFTVKFVPDPSAYSVLRLKFGVSDGHYYAFNTLPLIFGVHWASNLGASITATLQYANLGATLTALIQADYSELPEYINPKTHAVVIDLTENGIENWRRFVEIMFLKDGTEPFHYFYVSGSKKIYRLDKTRHWTVWVKSYRETTDDLIERRDTRNKYFFDLRNYSSIDEAITDFVDRVSDYRKANLMAAITCVDAVAANLGASITPIVVTRSWVRSLRAIITPV